MHSPPSMEKDRLTKIHQWLTVIAVPVGLALAGWIALEFDGLRQNMVRVQDAIMTMEKRLDAQGQAIEDIWLRLIAAKGN